MCHFPAGKAVVDLFQYWGPGGILWNVIAEPGSKNAYCFLLFYYFYVLWNWVKARLALSVVQDV